MSKPLTRRRHSKEQRPVEKQRLPGECVSQQNEPVYSEANVSATGNVKFYNVHSQAQKDQQPNFVGASWDKVSQANTVPLIPPNMQQDIWQGNTTFISPQDGANYTSGTDPWNWDVDSSQANPIVSQPHLHQQVQNYGTYQYHQQGSTEQAPVQMSVPIHWAPIEQAQPLQANLNQQHQWNYQESYFTENNSNNNAYNWQNEQSHNVNEYQQWYSDSEHTVNQPNVHNQKEHLAMVDQHSSSSVWGWDKHWTGNMGTDAVQQLAQTELVSSNDEMKAFKPAIGINEVNTLMKDNNVDSEVQPLANSSQNNTSNFTDVPSSSSNVESCYSNAELSESNGGLSAFFNNDSPLDSLVPSHNLHKSDQEETSCVEEHTQHVLHNNSIQNTGQAELDDESSHGIMKNSLQTHENINPALPGNIIDTVSDVNLVQQEMENLTLSTAMKHSENFTVEEPINQEVPEPSTDMHQIGSDVSERLVGVGNDLEQPVHSTTYQSTEEPVNQQVPDIVPVFPANQSTVDKSSSNSSSIVQQERGVVIRPREGSPFKPPSKQSHLLGSVVQQELDEDITKLSLPPPNHSVQEVNLEAPPENLEQPLDIETLSQQSSFSASFHRHHHHQRCNNSPSTTLWDSPDLPSVTLVPAAPALSSQSEKPLVTSGVMQENSIATSNCSPSAVPRQSPLGWEGSQPEVMTQPLASNNLAVPSEHHGQSSDSASLAEPDGVAIPSAPVSMAMELLHRTSPQGAGHMQQPSQSSASDVTSTPDMSHPHHNTHPRNNSQSVGEVRRARYDDTTLPSERHPRQEIDALSRQRTISSHRGAAPEREELNQPRRDVPQRKDFVTNFPHSANEQTSRWDRGYQGNRHATEDDPRRIRHHADDRSARSEIWDRRSDSRHYPDDKRYSSLDERDYFSERDRSRPSSRTSLSESIDGQERYYREREYRHMYYPDRGRTPTSESERGNWSNDRRYYRNSGYDNEMYNNGYGHFRRGDDPYQHQSNVYRGYNYDMYRRDPRSYYQYYDMYRYGYNNFNYGYYDELYRTDPRYHASLNERYQEYYAQVARDSDYERLSVHSGRSSVNDEHRESQNRYSREADQNSIVGSEYSGYNQNLQNESSYNYDFSVTTGLEEREPLPSSRLTPAKFSGPHPVACFSPGGLLLTVFPSISTESHSSMVQIHNIQELIGTEDDIAELNDFPGPLLRGKTHKNDVIQFCQKKVRQLKRREVTDRESYILLWELMIRLLRQNGCVDGSDVAELLLNNHEVLQPSTRQSADIIHEDGALLDTGESSRQISSGDTPSPDEGIVVTHERSSLNSTESSTRKFREFLFYGGKQEALEWAMKHNLWGHALFLASKMDSRTYANVMKRFANSLAPNDPLQTLYQLMSGRQPASVTRVADEKWGDWRPHLAMILSNPSPRTEVDLRSITTLGDTLASLGHLAAAHFCYLMAQVEFGSFSNKSSKLVLLGSSNLQSFQSFSSNEAIQCTEVYEYAQTLANPEYLLPHLQSYKFIYATRLLEYGFPQEALHYCEVISLTFHKLSGSVSPDLISQVYELANKLKYHDPHFTQGQGELEELGDPAWLVDLQRLRNYSDELNYSTNWSNSEKLSTDNANEDLDPSTQVNTDLPVVEHCIAPSAEVQNIQSFQGYSWANMGGIGQLNDQISSIQDVNLQQMTNGQYQFNYSNMQWNTDTVQPDQLNSVEGGPLEINASTNTSGTTLDYYSASTQKAHVSSPLLTKERADSSSSSTKWDRRDSTLSNQSGSLQSSLKQQASSISQSPVLKKPVENSKKLDGKDDKAKSQVGRTWLGGIFSKFLPKAPNQMILPDDKNPAIVWDSVKNRWVNTDEDEDDENGKPFAPPKDSELTKFAGEEFCSNPPNLSAGQNRFQKPKFRGMRQNYVDVLNPNNPRSQTNAPSELLLPPRQESTVSPEIFVPQTAPYSEEKVEDFVAQPQPPVVPPPPIPPDSPQVVKQHETSGLSPMMFDPAEFASRSGSNVQRPGMGRLARRAFLT